MQFVAHQAHRKLYFCCAPVTGGGGVAEVARAREFAGCRRGRGSTHGVTQGIAAAANTECIGEFSPGILPNIRGPETKLKTER